MKGMLINNEVLNKYFGLLSKLDNNTKKKLIIKLTESLDFKEELPNVSALFGAWEDTRSADEMIQEIQNARVEKQHTREF